MDIYKWCNPFPPSAAAEVDCVTCLKKKEKKDIKLFEKKCAEITAENKQLKVELADLHKKFKIREERMTDHIHVLHQQRKNRDIHCHCL
jgi:hypothetical protein